VQLTNRQRAIQENEQHALDAASTSSEMPPKTTISQTQETDPPSKVDQTKQPSTFVTVKRMVAPGSRDAPRFRSTRPEELRRFIRLMEDLWTDHGVTDDQEKKMMIGKYADHDCEEEWRAFENFKDGYS
jgi:hypothetical protein